MNTIVWYVIHVRYLSWFICLQMIDIRIFLVIFPYWLYYNITYPLFCGVFSLAVVINRICWMTLATSLICVYGSQSLLNSLHNRHNTQGSTVSCKKVQGLYDYWCHSIQRVVGTRLFVYPQLNEHYLINFNLKIMIPSYSNETLFAKKRHATNAVTFLSTTYYL